MINTGEGHGAGYGIVLLFVATIRELWGEGSLLGRTLIESSDASIGLAHNALMQQPASAFARTLLERIVELGYVPVPQAGREESRHQCAQRARLPEWSHR